MLIWRAICEYVNVSSECQVPSVDNILEAKLMLLLTTARQTSIHSRSFSSYTFLTRAFTVFLGENLFFYNVLLRRVYCQSWENLCLAEHLIAGRHSRARVLNLPMTWNSNGLYTVDNCMFGEGRRWENRAKTYRKRSIFWWRNTSLATVWMLFCSKWLWTSAK